MAVLKDLIVHGPSRFINGAKFNTINAESIGASEGIFNKLIATTLDAREATIDNLTTTNAKVVGMLDVEGELHTNSWTNANIANIGGSFYISPTIMPADGSTTITINRVSATSWTIQLIGTFATDFIKSGTSSTGVNWPANSLVLVTGNVTLNNMVYPLGTLKGTLSSAVTASAASTSKTITITGVVDGQGGNTPYVLQELYELNGNANLTTKAFTNGKISLYKLGSYPIGIQLSSMGVDSNSIIDIYGGVKSTPTVRIGHLAGLPAINESAPTGWGIYTDNGYFNGVIVSQSGKIGGFSIGSADLSNGSLGTAGSVWVSTGTDGAASIGGSESITNWAFTAGNSFGVTTDGTVYASGARISGNVEITSSDTIYTKDEVNAELSLKITNPEEDEGADFMTALNAVIDRLNIIADNIFLGSDSNVSVADELNKFNSSISIDTSHSTVQIGQASDFNVLITPTRLSFMNGQTEVAYISQNQLFIKQSVVLDQMDLGRVEGSEDPVTGEIGKGQWAWTVHENSSGKNNLHLKWMG